MDKKYKVFKYENPKFKNKVVIEMKKGDGDLYHLEVISNSKDEEDKSNDTK